jgi:hypothetical protein
MVTLQVQAEMNELVDFLVEKVSQILKVERESVTVREDEKRDVYHIYHIEINKSTSIHYEFFEEFEDLIGKLGFWPFVSDTKTVEENDGHKLTSEVHEYINSEMVRIILFYDKEIVPDRDDYGVPMERRVYHLKKIIVGKTSMINSPIARTVQEMINKLEMYGISYKFSISSSYPFIDIEGHVSRMWATGFEFKYRHCVSIIVSRWKTDKLEKIEIRYWCGNKPEIVEIPIPKKVKVDIVYDDGVLSFRFS